jgi:hypothetical protein
MRLRAFAPILALATTLSFAAASCGKVETEPADEASASAPAAVQPPSETPETAPSASPVAAEPAAPPTSRDPAVVLEAWRHALETHDYAAARAVWGESGAASEQSPEQFASAWDKYRIIDITVGEGRQEGAAGSLYYEAPVTVTGLRRDGAPYHLAGTVTLRRANDVPGATPEQLRWHIESSTLRP